MSVSYPVTSIYTVITDIDGQPLESGYVWIGQPDLDPQTNPIQVYWDKELTITAPQPIRTIGGYLARSGSPANVYAATDFSMRVMNKNGSIIYSAPKNSIGEILAQISENTATSLTDYAALRAYVGPQTRVYITGALGAAKPAGIVGVFQHDPSDTTTADNGGTVIVGSDGRRWKRDYSGQVSAAWFGAVPGATDSTAALQAAANVLRDGEMVIPGGQYTVNGDLVLLSKGRAPESGAFKVEATGATFVGTGRVVVNSCKRLQINGLDMPNMDLVFRGCWWGQFSNIRFKRLHINDAPGAGFSQNYWNQFQQCQFQTVLTDAASTGPSNEFTFESCSMRGNVGQGFTGTAAFAFEFNANQNCQAWKFNNGDISYHTTEIYSIGAANTTGDVELAFDGVYFDSILPKATARDKTRIREVNCHHANGQVGYGGFTAMTCRTLDQFRTDRSFKMDAWSGINLIPNGDFKDRLSVWAGAGLPVSADAGAEITRIPGGFYGNALNINQTNTTNNAVRFGSKTLPFPGRLTGVMIVRNADPGTRTIGLGFPGPRNPTGTITSDEWTVFTLTNNTIFGGTGTRQDIYIYTNDGTPFNVDVAYVAITYGEGSPLALNSASYPVINHIETWDAPEIPAGGQIVQTFTVDGVVQGDFVLASFLGDIDQLDVSAHAKNNNQIALKIRNDSATARDLGAGQWRFRVFKRGYS